MRIRGRSLFPSTLQERRALKRFGADCIRVPRRMNPFAVARHVERLARGSQPDAMLIRHLVEIDRLRPNPAPSPGVDLPAEPDSRLTDAVRASRRKQDAFSAIQ